MARGPRSKRRSVKGLAEDLVQKVPAKNGETPESWLRRFKTLLRRHPDIKAALFHGSALWGHEPNRSRKEPRKRKVQRDYDFLVVARGKAEESEAAYVPQKVRRPDGSVLMQVTPVVATQDHLTSEAIPVTGGLGHFASYALSPREIVKGRPLIDEHMTRLWQTTLPDLVQYGIIPREIKLKKGEEGDFLFDVAKKYFTRMEPDKYHPIKSVLFGWGARPNAVSNFQKESVGPFVKALKRAGFKVRETESGLHAMAPDTMKRSRFPRLSALTTTPQTLKWRGGARKALRMAREDRNAK